MLRREWPGAEALELTTPGEVGAHLARPGYGLGVTIPPSALSACWRVSMHPAKSLAPALQGLWTHRRGRKLRQSAGKVHPIEACLARQ
jgi:hypothetical protein